LLGLAVTKLGIRPLEFWELTFAEFWAIHDAIFVSVKKNDFNAEEYDKYMKAWENGNT
jgi:hypothetical protein